MMNLSRNRRAAALGLAFAGLWTGALAAQDNETVGNPQLKNFQLPGQRTTPPAPPQTQPAPAPVAARPAPPTVTPTTATPRPSPSESIAPAARAPVRTQARVPERAAPASPRPPIVPPAVVNAAPAPTPVATATAPVPRAAPPVATPAPAARQAPAPEAPASAPFSLNWLWLAFPVLLGLGGFFLLRRRRALGERDESHRGALAGALFSGGEAQPPVAEPAAPEPAPEPAEAPRPWLELDIEPDRAASTPSEASLHYELVVTNVGGETARNIRIDTRMFNAADEQQIAAFLGGPIHRHSGSPHVTLPPGESLRLTAQTAMKADEVRAIELQGRSIFVPSLATNVAYDWGEAGEGRTSKSWLVGRKATQPNARMGAFRLDLGPRIYRSVGRTDAKRVMV